MSVHTYCFPASGVARSTYVSVMSREWLCTSLTLDAEPTGQRYAFDVREGFILEGTQLDIPLLGKSRR